VADGNEDEAVRSDRTTGRPYSSARSADPVPDMLAILDTGPEPSFDALTEAASRIFGVPVALIVLVGEERRWCKSAHGTDWNELPPGPCFCDRLAAGGMDLLLIQDAQASAEGELVPEGMRFCAGVPLVLPGGARIGAFCMLDPSPRPDLDRDSLAMLGRLAENAVGLIEARGTTAELRRLHQHVQLSDALGGIALDGADFAAAVTRAAEALGRHLAADLVTLAQYEPELAGILHLASWSHDPAIREILADRIAGRPLGVAETPSCVAIREQQPLMVEDLGDRGQVSESLVADLLRQVGMVQYLVVPFRMGEARYGITLGYRRGGTDLAQAHDRVLAIRSRLVALFQRKQASDRLAFLGSILDQSGDGLCVLEQDEADPELRRFIYVNQAMTGLTGYAPEELIGAPVSIMEARADAPEMIERARDRLARGEPAELETLNRRKSGDEIWLNLRMAPYRGPGGRRRYIVAARDMTERRRMEEDLRELQSQARRLFEQNPVPMWLHDRQDLRFLDVNDAALRQFGFAREAFLELRLPELCVEEEAGASVPAWPRGGDGEGTGRTWRLATGAGEERVVTLIAHDFNGDLGNGILVAAIDVTRERRYEASLRHAKLQAEQANATKSEFLAHMSHEMRTPLNAIIGFSDMIQSGIHGPLGSQKYLDYVAAIQDSGSELLLFVNDVLQLIEMESSVQHIEVEPVDLQDLVYDVLGGFTAAFAEKDIRLRLLAVSSGLGVHADLQAVRQVLTHVLDNLVRFCAGASVEIRSELLGARQVALHVSDTGPGIPDHVLAEIFSPFFTSRSMTRRSGQGAGLGLPICHRMMQAQGGEIRIDSHSGQGTTVTLCLPRMPRLPRPGVDRVRPGSGD